MAKIKNMVADAQLVVPEPEQEYVSDEEPTQYDAPIEDVPVSEAPQSEVTNEDKPVSENNEGDSKPEE